MLIHRPKTILNARESNILTYSILILQTNFDKVLFKCAVLFKAFKMSFSPSDDAKSQVKNINREHNTDNATTKQWSRCVSARYYLFQKGSRISYKGGWFRWKGCYPTPSVRAVTHMVLKRFSIAFVFNLFTFSSCFLLSFIFLNVGELLQ